MGFTAQEWYLFLYLSLLLFAVIAYPTVALLVTWPLQRKLRLKHHDYITDIAIWPFRSIYYAMAIVIPFIRWKQARNRCFIQGMHRTRQAASSLQRWLSFWLMASMCGMVLLGFLMMLLEYLGVWSGGSI
jgi:hypothetical protein